MGNCIFTQDGEMRQRGEWKYTIPDKFGRMALAGICKNQLSYDKKPLGEIAVVASYTVDFRQSSQAIITIKG